MRRRFYARMRNRRGQGRGECDGRRSRTASTGPEQAALGDRRRRAAAPPRGPRLPPRVPDGRSGPRVLLIHGIGDSSATWADLIPDLARNHTVIAPDLLGHGASDKPRADYSVAAYANGIRDLLGVLGIERATLVGHSLGGGWPCSSRTSSPSAPTA